MSRSKVKKINGKSKRFVYRQSKRRIIKKSKRFVKNAVGCGTAINRSRMYKMVERKRRLNEVWYYPEFGGVYVKFDSNDNVQTLRFVGSEISLDNGLKIGSPKDSVNAVLSTFYYSNDTSPSVAINHSSQCVDQIILHDGSDDALEFEGHYFFDFE